MSKRDEDNTFGNNLPVNVEPNVKLKRVDGNLVIHASIYLAYGDVAGGSL